MSCCLTAPSHYLKRCWLIISRVRSGDIHLMVILQDIGQPSIIANRLKITYLHFNYVAQSCQRFYILIGIKWFDLHDTFYRLQQIYLSDKSHVIWYHDHFTAVNSIFHIFLTFEYATFLIGSLYRHQITKFMGPTWGPSGSCRPQMGPMLAPWTLLSEPLYAHQINGSII